VLTKVDIKEGRGLQSILTDIGGRSNNIVWHLK